MLNQDIKQMIKKSKTFEDLQVAEELLRNKIRNLRRQASKSAECSILSKIIQSVKEEESIEDKDVLEWGPKVQAIFQTLNEDVKKRSENEQSFIEDIHKMIGESQMLLGVTHKKMKDIIWADFPPPCE